MKLIRETNFQFLEANLQNEDGTDATSEGEEIYV